MLSASQHSYLQDEYTHTPEQLELERETYFLPEIRRGHLHPEVEPSAALLYRATQSRHA